MLTHATPFIGSSEEADDLKAAYLETEGSFDEIMKHIPHSTIDDEPRFVVTLSNLVQAGDLPSLPQWESSSKDEKAKLVRKKQGDKEAKEAEELAKELGVWDEFYGSGRTGARKGKAKAKKPADDEDEDEGDTSALQALILKKQKNRNTFLDDLAAKYTGMAESSNKKGGMGKKRKKGADESEAEVESPKKKPHGQDPPDINDEEFANIQQKLFAEKRKPPAESSAKGRRSGRAKKAK